MLGRTISHYRITAQLGAGGMGVVYAGEDVRLGRAVALKFVPEDLTDDQRTLLIDHCKYWSFKVDDVYQRQAKGNVITDATSRAAYRLADVMDHYVASKYTEIHSGNVYPAVTIETSNPSSWTTERRHGGALDRREPVAPPTEDDP